MAVILVVEDDELALRTLLRLLPRDWEIRTASDESTAHERLAHGTDWAGFLLDVSLKHEKYAGVELLRKVRSSWPLVPAALVTATLEPGVINTAANLGATMIAKPASLDALHCFIARVNEAMRASKRASRVALAATTRYDLLPGEANIVWWVAAGNRVATLGAHTGIPDDTLARMTDALLRKVEAPTVEGLVMRVMCEEAANASATT